MLEILIVLFLIFLWVYYYTKCPGIEWCKKVKEEYKNIKNRFGLPMFFSNEGKVVLWERLGKDVPFSRIMLENRCDYPLTLTIKYYIDTFKLQDILELSDTIIYDKLKRELSVRATSLEEGMSMLVIVNNFNKDLISVSQVNRLIMQGSNLTKKTDEYNYTVLKNIKDDYYISNN